ncbi:MAG: UbiH/UbiF/VisC/COQ6 family ubiquinone biosynthesis hydroxylase [Proteobacteria bacterium]|nr:UbiH/UbiF/VisC/COQ6 family ubiquinone biosynthesis hydroxylase [Pseudomonadota bacterium]
MGNQFNHEYDVIVVGAGIVGLAAALAFAKQELSVALIEAHKPSAQFPLLDEAIDAKVVAITRASENFFSYLGVWQDIKASRYSPYHHMCVWDSVMDGIIHFSAMDFFEDNLGYIIEQKVILAALLTGLQKQSSVHYFWGEYLADFSFQNGSQITLTNGTKLKAKLVIGADGAKSTLRKLCHIDSAYIDYQQVAIVATLQSEKSHTKTAYQRFAQDGPLALLPLSDENLSSLVWTTTPEKANELMQVTKNEFGLALTRECDAILGNLTLMSKPLMFPLSSHHAKSYVTEGCVLVGDAAHTIHPLAGLGVNLGLLDVATLVEMLALKSDTVQKRETHLKHYERQRKTHNQLMIWAMSAFKQGFGSQNALVAYLRNLGLGWVDKHFSLKQFFAKMAMGTLGPIPQCAKKNIQRTDSVKKNAII